MSFSKEITFCIILEISFNILNIEKSFFGINNLIYSFNSFMRINSKDEFDSFFFVKTFFFGRLKKVIYFNLIYI